MSSRKGQRDAARVVRAEAGLRAAQRYLGPALAVTVLVILIGALL